MPCTTPLGRPWERAQAKLNHLRSSNDAGEMPGSLARARGSWRPLDRQDGEAAKSPMDNSTCQLTAAKARNHSWAAQRWTDWERVKRSLPNSTSPGTHRQCPLVAPIQTNRAADPGVALGGQALSQHAQRVAANSGGANAATSNVRDLTNATGNESLVGGGICGSALGTLLPNPVANQTTVRHALTDWFQASSTLAAAAADGTGGRTRHLADILHLQRDSIHSSVTWPRDCCGHLFPQHSISHLSVDERAHQNEASTKESRSCSPLRTPRCHKAGLGDWPIPFPMRGSSPRFSPQTTSRRRTVTRAPCNPRESQKWTPC